MELKHGYKQTEAGVIPEDWTVSKMGKIANVIMGQSPLSEFYNNKGIGLPLIQGNADIENRKTIVRSYSSMITKRGKLGDIIMSVRAPVGEVAKSTFDCCLGRGVCAISFKNEYLYHYLVFFEKSWAKFSTGSTFDSINSTQVIELPIPIPKDDSEQLLIANALSDMDALISQTEKLIEKKKAIKQGAMQELLKPKDGWVTKKLSDIGKTYGGLSGKSKVDFEKGNAFYIPFMNVMSSPIIKTDYFDSVNIGLGEKQNKAMQGDLFFNGSSETPEEVGMCSVLTESIDNLYLNSFCFGFRLNDAQTNNGLFLAYYFRSGYGREAIYSLAQGATRYNLSKSNFLKMELPLPSIDIQIEITNCISDMDLELLGLQNKLNKLKQQKQGMMQALLTGKIRLVS